MELDTRAQVWSKTQGHCWYCGKLMNPWDDFTVDHMDPRIQGGGDEITNLVPCCKTCNSRKGGKTVVEYKAYLAAKTDHTFWFEHHEALLEVYDQVAGGDPEEMPPKYQNSLECYLRDFMLVGIHKGCPVTLLSLFQDALQNYKETGDSETGEWFFLVEEFAQETGQTVDEVFRHIMTLRDSGILWFSGDAAPRGGHHYILYINEVLSTAEHLKCLRAKKRQALTEE